MHFIANRPSEASDLEGKRIVLVLVSSFMFKSDFDEVFIFKVLFLKYLSINVLVLVQTYFEDIISMFPIPDFQSEQQNIANSAEETGLFFMFQFSFYNSSNYPIFSLICNPRGRFVMMSIYNLFETLARGPLK